GSGRGSLGGLVASLHGELAAPGRFGHEDADVLGRETRPDQLVDCPPRLVPRVVDSSDQFRHDALPVLSKAACIHGRRGSFVRTITFAAPGGTMRTWPASTRPCGSGSCSGWCRGCWWRDGSRWSV